MKIKASILISSLLVSLPAHAEEPVTLFAAARVFDGEHMHRDWLVATAGEKIVYAGETRRMPELAVHNRIDLPGQNPDAGLDRGSFSYPVAPLQRSQLE